MKSWIALAVLTASSAAYAEPADVAAAAAADTRSEANVAMDEGRKPVEILQWAGLEQGDSVLDFFGSNLYWAEIIVPAIGDEARYTIWSASQFFDDDASARVAAFQEAHPNVDLDVERLEEAGYDDGAYDFVIVNLNTHDFWWQSEDFGIERMDPARHAQEIADALKPGGRLLVIDHRGAPTDDVRAQVDALHRIDPAAVIDLYGDAGLYLKGTSDLLVNSEDDLSINVFSPEIRGKTSRFVHLYMKPE